MNMSYFNAEAIRDALVKWIADWFEQNGKDKYAVIGISGGKDSTVVAALCARALGKERVLGVMMPNGYQRDIGDSMRVCEALEIPNIVVNIEGAYKGVESCVAAALVGTGDGGISELSEQTLINIAPRLRMTTLYAVSQTIGGRVVNTSNASECFVGYGTLYGDLAGSMYPLKNLTKSEIVEIGKTMTEIPIELVEKTPSDGLTGFTDENKFGFTYDELDSTIRFGTKGEHYNTIMKRHNDNLFKLKPFEEFHP